MKKDNTGFEDFVGRHRADFDAFEPRPDLWDAIARDLDAAPGAAPEAPLRIVPLRPISDTPAQVARRPLRVYGIAATLALLLLAGLGVLWTKNPAAPAWTRAGVTSVAVQSLGEKTTAPDKPFGLGSELLATAAGEAPAQRTAAAVQRMEAYYAVQIRERQQELNQLDARPGAAPTDWKRELADLDSTYRQLKVELARNPEPDVVLDAMNRNLQIRLDILNQQLRTRAQAQDYSEEAPQP